MIADLVESGVLLQKDENLSFLTRYLDNDDIRSCYGACRLLLALRKTQPSLVQEKDLMESVARRLAVVVGALSSLREGRTDKSIEPEKRPPLSAIDMNKPSRGSRQPAVPSYAKPVYKEEGDLAQECQCRVIEAVLSTLMLLLPTAIVAHVPHSAPNLMSTLSSAFPILLSTVHHLESSSTPELVLTASVKLQRALEQAIVHIGLLVSDVFDRREQGADHDEDEAFGGASLLSFGLRSLTSSQQALFLKLLENKSADALVDELRELQTHHLPVTKVDNIFDDFENDNDITKEANAEEEEEKESVKEEEEEEEKYDDEEEEEEEDEEEDKDGPMDTSSFVCESPRTPIPERSSRSLAFSGPHPLDSRRCSRRSKSIKMLLSPDEAMDGADEDEDSSDDIDGDKNMEAQESHRVNQVEVEEYIEEVSMSEDGEDGDKEERSARLEQSEKQLKELTAEMRILRRGKRREEEEKVRALGMLETIKVQMAALQEEREKEKHLHETVLLNEVLAKEKIDLLDNGLQEAWGKIKVKLENILSYNLFISSFTT